MRNFLRSIIRVLGLYATAITVENKIGNILNKKKRLKLYGQFIKKGSLVFDVGANEGNRTAIFLELNAKVIAIEPQADCVAILKKKFGSKITIVEKGLDEKKGEKLLYKSDTSLISSFNKDYIDAVKDDRFKGAHWEASSTMQMTTLDQLIKEYGIPDFCKIDVEGYEQQVLKGLSTPLKSLSFEFVVPENLNNALLCIELLIKLGEIECNFSYGESMELALTNWKEGNEMLEYMKTPMFEAYSYGDIYVRFLKS